MTNDVKAVDLESIEQSVNKEVEYVTIETANLASQDYWKSTETIDAGISVRNQETTLERFSGDGSDWDITIAGTTTLSRDMFYNNLIVTWTLNTTGYRVFVKNLCQVSETGVIQANGNAWGNGTAWWDWLPQNWSWWAYTNIPWTSDYVGRGWLPWAWGIATASGTIFGTIAWVTGTTAWWVGWQNSWWRGTSSWDTSTWWPIAWAWGNNWTAVTHSLNTLSGNSWWEWWYRWVWPWASWWTWSTVTQIKQNITDALSARIMYWFDWTNISLYKSAWVWGSWWWGMWGIGWAWWATLAGWWGWWAWWGWASGWIVRIRAKQIINNWYIQANWGNWGNGWNGWSLSSWFANWGMWWWGGAWGNWWYVLLICRIYQWKGITQAIWGTWWTAWSSNPSYSAASNGSNGAVWITKTITL